MRPTRITPARPTTTPTGALRLPRLAPTLLILAAAGIGTGAVRVATRIRHNRRLAAGRPPLSLALELPGDGRPLHLVVLGDSAAAGHGLDHPDQTYARQVARGLAATGCQVRLSSLAVDGATTSDVLATQLPRVEAADVVLVAVGANDALHGHTLTRVERATRRVLSDLARRLPGATLVLMTCPDLSTAAAVPVPLRPLVGWRCRAVRDVQARLASDAGVSVFDIERHRLVPDVFGPDRFHPGRVGHERIAARLLAEHLAELRSDVRRG